MRIFEKKRKTHKKTSGRAVVTAYSDVPYKPTIKETMGWLWFEGRRQANKKKAMEI